MQTRELVRKLEVLRVRPSRVVDVLREPRPIVVGGPIANRLGLQVARALTARALWYARPERVTPAVRQAYDALLEDGIAVVPDFLPPEDFAKVRADYGRSQTDPFAKQTVFGENLIADDVLVSDQPKRYPDTLRLLRDNEFILQLAAAATRRAITYRPHVTFLTVRRLDPDGPIVDLDYNQYAHVDRPYAFVKVFYYLNDVGPGDTAFCYARGSHKLTPARIRYEYEYSVAHVAARRSPKYVRNAEQLQADGRLRDLSDALVATFGPCEPITGRANTLIVVNNQGFHKRGPVETSKPRATVNMDFKYLESRPARVLYPLLKYFYRDV